MAWNAKPKESAGAYDQHPNFILIPEERVDQLARARAEREAMQRRKRAALLGDWHAALLHWCAEAPGSLNRAAQEEILARIEGELALIPHTHLADVMATLVLAEVSIGSGRTPGAGGATMLSYAADAIRRGRLG